MSEIMAEKYVHLMLPGGFPDKVPFEIDSTNETVVKCCKSISSCKNVF